MSCETTAFNNRDRTTARRSVATNFRFILVPSTQHDHQDRRSGIKKYEHRVAEAKYAVFKACFDYTWCSLTCVKNIRILQ
jgi:hypothetical protein